MGRASTDTLLSLDRFAQLCGLHPIHFNQCYLADLAPTGLCDRVILQHSWQMADAVSREEIALAIAEAEIELENYMGFAPAPKWYNEWAVPTRHFRPEWSPNALQFNLKGYVQSGGQRGATLILNRPVAYTDADGDGYDELATVTCATTVTNEAAIKIFYPGKSGEPEWEIRPLKDVVIAGGTATITFNKHQCLLESLQEALNAEAEDALLDANFLGTVDVYEVVNDPSIQAQFWWRNSCGCDSADGCPSCEYTTQHGCISVVSERLGQVRSFPGTFDSSDDTFANAYWSIGRLPDKVRTWYYAGYPLKNNKMDLMFELAITRLAMNKLDRPICACPSIQSNFEYWNVDLAISNSDPNGGSISRQLGDLAINSPFGTHRGEIWAYQIALRNRLGTKAGV